jgi:uncharacterized membrane protein YfcA
MEYALISAVALIVSGLTLFSGFGLGTALMPAFALFFPVQTAIAATAVVHLANNLFKLALVGRRADWGVALRFGAPAALAAVAGAGALVLFSVLPPLAAYQLLGAEHEVTPVKLLIGVSIVCFATLELSPRFAALEIPSRYLVAGGLLSGFFGGLSGNQGAFRSAFLIKAGLSKEAFVATGVVSAVIVDTVRLAVYGVSQLTAHFEALPKDSIGVVIAATVAAFAGAFFGARLLGKVTLRTVQIIVAATMFVIGFGLAAGLI